METGNKIKTKLERSRVENVQNSFKINILFPLEIGFNQNNWCHAMSCRRRQDGIDDGTAGKMVEIIGRKSLIS